MEPHVLISGAGPTGLLLAADLARRGVPFRIVEKSPQPSQLSRAIAVHARTLEILRDLGCATDLCERGIPLRRVRFFRKGEVMVDVDFGQLDTAFPYLLCVHQTETEAVLAATVQRHGGQIERGVRYAAMTQDEGGVTSTVVHPDGREEQIRSAWLVGCDGSHSQVRKDAGLEFSGAAFAEDLWLVDCRLTDPGVPRDGLSSFFAPSGFMACFPMKGDRVRLLCTAPQEAEDGYEPVVEDLRAVWNDRSHFGGELIDDIWTARFKIHARQVSTYRNGRVLVAGDAAHIHSPVGGQGMNTGLQDAHNLGWKLAHAYHGGADLIDSYVSERHALGQRLLLGTDIATRIGTWRNPILRAIRDATARLGSTLAPVQQVALRGLAELDVNYRGSAIVGGSRKFITGLRPGDRAPDLEGRISGLTWTVLLVGGSASFADLAARVQARFENVSIHFQSSGTEGIFVIRPDLYVGWRGRPEDGDALLAHLGGHIDPSLS